MKELEIIDKIKKNRIKYEDEMKTLVTGKDWEHFIEKWFKVSKWPKKNYKEVFRELKKRKPFIKSGFKWYSFVQSYKISPELYFEYSLALEKERKSLDPKMHRRLYSRKSQGRGCEYCFIYVKSTKPKKCPICGRRLFYARITED